jgi:aminoglycoside 2''-phosphotransferase
MNRKEMRDAIARCCPEWEISSIRHLGEGDFCTAYIVNDEWVLRVGKHETARRSLSREYCLLPRLADQLTLRIPSPQIAGTDENGELLFIAYPLLPGPHLSKELYASLDAHNRTRCAEQVALFLTQLHSIELSSARGCGVSVQDYGGQYSGLLLRARAELYPFLDEPVKLFIERVVGAYLESGDALAFQPALLHGDLSPDHVLFDEESMSVNAIIDFGDMTIGDPAWDLVLIYEDYGLDFLSRLLKVYGKPEGAAMPRRMYQLYLLAAIDWAAGSKARGDAEFAEAIEQLRLLSIQEGSEREELFSACGLA